jgi:anti-anti-sigma factor
VQGAATIGIEIECAEEAGEVQVTCRGDAGFAGAETLRRVLFGVAARRPRRVGVDLSDVQFVSTLALGVLVAFRGAVERGGGRVSFTSLCPLPTPLA